MADPALRLSYPTLQVDTKTVNGVVAGLSADTLSALSKVTITGQVNDNFGNNLQALMAP
jgi:hypothetical protein